MSESSQSSPAGALPGPDRAGSGSLGDGIMFGVVVVALAVAVCGGLWIGGVGGEVLLIVVFLGLVSGSPLVLAGGIVLTIQKRTRRFGAGLLVTTSIGVLAFGGVFVALVNRTFE